MSGMRYFEVNKMYLKLFGIWPEKNDYFLRLGAFGEYFLPSYMFIHGSLALIGSIFQIYEKETVLVNIVYNFASTLQSYGAIYVFVCFKLKQKQIIKLLMEIKKFEKYCNINKIQKTEKWVSNMSHFFFAYSIGAVSGYLILSSFSDCVITDYMVRHGIPCKMVFNAYLPVKYNTWPLKPIVSVGLSCCFYIVATVYLISASLICGLLKHITENIKNLKSFIIILGENHGKYSDTVIDRHLKTIYSYHNTIISYTKLMAETFAQLLLWHIGITSLTIALLVFQCIASTNTVNIIRFVLNILGYLSILFGISFFGQSLLDESSSVSMTLFHNVPWYRMPVDQQKKIFLIMLRSQKSLKLDAAGVTAMCYATFLKSLHTAYSYLTLMYQTYSRKN